MSVACEWCGARFMRTKKHPRKRYCSRLCARRGRAPKPSTLAERFEAGVNRGGATECPEGDANWTRRHPEQIKRGADHPRARLTRQQAQALRERYAQGGLSTRALAAEYGLDYSLVWKVVTGRRYV